MKTGAQLASADSYDMFTAFLQIFAVRLFFEKNRYDSNTFLDFSSKIRYHTNAEKAIFNQ